MVLLLQVVAVVVAAVVISAAVGKTRSSASFVSAIAVLAVALGYLAFADRVWQVGQLFAQQQKAWAPLDPNQAALAGAPAVETAFAEWIRGHVRPGDTFFIVGNAGRDPGVLQWFTYRLLPNLSATDEAHADVLIFYSTTPRQEHDTRLIRGRAEIFAPEFSIARTKNAA
jgi:hypothetical protein